MAIISILHSLRQIDNCVTFHIIKVPIVNGLNTVRKQYTDVGSKLQSYK